MNNKKYISIRRYNKEILINMIKAKDKESAYIMAIQKGGRVLKVHELKDDRQNIHID